MKFFENIRKNRTAVMFFIACSVVFAMLAIPVTAWADESDVVKVDNGIPVVYLNIDETQGTIEDMIASPDHSVYCYGTITIDVPEGFHYTDFEDLVCESIQELSMSIRGRGNSTWKKDMKKPYKIKLDKKTDIFGLGKNKHWALLANSSDNTLIRDRITAWLGDEMGFDFTPRGVPVDLVMTGQEYGSVYLGSYYFTETVRVDDNRLEIAELEEDDTDPAVITGGYLLQDATQLREGSLDRFYTKRGVDWGTETPSFDTETEALLASQKDGDSAETPGILTDAYENHVQQEYIQNYIQEFEDTLFEEGTAYREYMDVENAAKYWLMNIFPLNNDAYATGSTYIYKDRDPEVGISKLYWGPLWDFDYAWDYKDETEGLSYGHDWMKPLFYDREEGGFIEEVHKQWPKLKSLAEELIVDGGLIDRYYEETKASADQDRKLWPMAKEGTYEDEIERLKTWIRDRITWFDENLNQIDSMMHKVTLVSGQDVYMTDFQKDGDEYSVQGIYPEREGYTFLGWLDEDGHEVESDIRIYKDTILTAKYAADSEMTHAKDIAFRKDSDIIQRNIMMPTYQIPYEIIPADAEDQKVRWSSSNEAFATVDEYGKVRYSGTGEATFTAELRLGTTRTFTLTVTSDAFPVLRSVSAEEEKLKLSAGEQRPFLIQTDPSPVHIDDYEYWSDNESVVTVDEMGVITAVRPGHARVFVRVTAAGEEDDVVLETYTTVNVNNKPLTDIPNTGSNPHLGWYIAMAAGSLGLLLAGMFRKRKNQTED